jgi:hypothetical protein
VAVVAVIRLALVGPEEPVVVVRALRLAETVQVEPQTPVAAGAVLMTEPLELVAQVL